jgi:hypothetical protein
LAARVKEARERAVNRKRNRIIFVLRIGIDREAYGAER